MMVKKTSSPFGGQTRTRVLLALRLMGESYPRELARLLDAPLSVVQKGLLLQLCEQSYILDRNAHRRTRVGARHRCRNR